MREYNKTLFLVGKMQLKMNSLLKFIDVLVKRVVLVLFTLSFVCVLFAFRCWIKMNRERKKIKTNLQKWKNKNKTHVQWRNLIQYPFAITVSNALRLTCNGIVSLFEVDALQGIYWIALLLLLLLMMMMMIDRALNCGNASNSKSR